LNPPIVQKPIGSLPTEFADRRIQNRVSCHSFSHTGYSSQRTFNIFSLEKTMRVGLGSRLQS
jgi:hypothetical protein